MDVVPARAEEWTVPPFGGIQRGGYFWGRGAVDMKSLGVAELMAFLSVHRRGTPLSRDLVFLGVPDEEAGGLQGVGRLLEDHPELFEGVGYVLNEGGVNEVIVDRTAYWGIEVDQKLPLWLRISTTGPRGHGAVPPPGGGSVETLVRLLGRILEMPRPYQVTPSVRESFAALAPTKRGKRKEVLARVDQYIDSPELEQALSESYRALLHDTLTVTGLEAGGVVNVVPGQASALIDMRLLPGHSPDAILERIRSIVGDHGEVEVLLRSEPVPPSPTNTPLYHTLESVMHAAAPDSVVGPKVQAGTSDSRFFRARGIVAYGISPFKINYYDLATIHGSDERIRVRFFDEGIGVMRSIIERFCLESGEVSSNSRQLSSRYTRGSAELNGSRIAAAAPAGF